MKTVGMVGWAAAGLCAFSLVASPALADKDDATRLAARSLGTSGVEAYQAGDYQKANEKLDKAYRALKAPSLGLCSAGALAKLNRLVEAAERYQEVIRLQPSGGDERVQQQAKADAETELAQLAPQIPNLTVKLNGATADQVTVTIDGEPLAASLIDENRPVNPGKHRVEARRGSEVVAANVDVKVGETKPVELRFQGASAAPATPGETKAAGAPSANGDAKAEATPQSSPQSGGHSPRKLIGFVTLGVGGAGLVLGGVAAGIAVSKRGALDDSGACRGNTCLVSQQPTVDAYNLWGKVSTAGLIGGAVLAVAGVSLILTAPSEQEQVALTVGPGSLSLGRTF
jgi:hypothetical protein